MVLQCRSAGNRMAFLNGDEDVFDSTRGQAVWDSGFGATNGYHTGYDVTVWTTLLA